MNVFPWQQGVVIGVGEMSEFGSVFKMMQSEEVSTTSIHFVCLCGISLYVCMYVCTLEMHPISIFAVPLHIYTYMYIVPYGVQM